MSTPCITPTFTIRVDDQPYQGEADETEPAPCRWVQNSPRVVNRLKFGHWSDQPMHIVGSINLRSHLERIINRLGALDIRHIIIDRIDR